MAQINKLVKRDFTTQQIKTFSEIVNRAALASRMGYQYGTDRNLYQALGYPETMTYKDYYNRYQRQDIAKAIIDRPVSGTWQGALELIESNEPDETEFEEAWRQLNRTLGLKTRFARVDRLAAIGRYGILLLGLNDTKNVDSFAKPVTEGTYELVYVKPFGEDTAKISTWVTDTKDERYGLPLLYEITVADMASSLNKNVKVHYSRVIHITNGTLESEVYGTPVMQAVYNRLLDIEKLVGGDAEMFWRGARPGYHGKVDPDYTMTEATKEDLKNQLDEMEHNLRRYLINEGVDIEALAQQIADPGSHFQTQLQCISAETGIPLRILTGSERGELASSEDRSEWLSYVQTRREEHAEPRILRPTVDRFIELGILPEPEDDYTVKWADLFAQSEKARVEIGKSRSNSLREYMSSPMAMEVIPPSAFMEKFLGFTVDEIELITEIRDSEMMEEAKKMKQVKDIISPEPPPMPGQTGQKPKEKTKAQRGEPKTKRKMPSASV